MSSPSRLHVALPAALTFVFGLTFGLIAGRILWHGGQPTPGPMAASGEGGMSDPHAGHVDEGPSEEEMRRMLASHEGLLATSPEDVSLRRTIGNYYSLLGENEKALEHYAQALEIALKQGNAAEARDIIVDEAITHVDMGDIPKALARLEEVSAQDPKDVRSRLTRVAVYLERVIPQPPPGTDRKQAVASAEVLLDEIEALDPENGYAAQFRATIDSIRQMMGRPRSASDGSEPVAGLPATSATP